MEQFLCPHCNKVFDVQEKPADMILHCPLCNGSISLQADDLKPGANLGGFEIISLLGKGGMGNVYLAKQSSMDRLVALKVLVKSKVGESDRSIIDMFNKEIQLSGKLNHPNIIKAINAGEDEYYYYMAITYVEGEDFEKQMDRGIVMPEKEGFSLALKISNALSYAWEKHGLLHKDIKPGNIMRDKKGEIFLMDMGIAQHMVFGSTQREKEIHGSPFYMSPEQGQGLPLDWSTDMYSLGATLYHMIGVPPYDSKEVTRIIEKHITDPFPEPITRNPNVRLNKNTVTILKKMLAKKPADRFASWQEFDSAVNKAFFSNQAQAGKKKVPTKFAFYGGSKKPKSSPVSLMMILVNSFILLIVALCSAYFINEYRKTNAAETNLNIAEKFYIQHPLNYEESIRLFSIAKESSKDTNFYLKASRRYSEVSAKGAAFVEKAKTFDETWVKAYRLFIDRKYQEAINLLESIKEIEDPARRNDAVKFINQIKEAMSSEKTVQKPPKKN